MNFLADATASWLTADCRVRLSGFGHAAYVSQHLTAAFSQRHPQVRFAIELHGTPSAMAFAINGKALLRVMGREITPDEIVPWRKQRGGGPLGVRVAVAARDTRQHLATSLALYVHRGNPLARINLIQLAAIFSSGTSQGDITCRSQLGLGAAWQHRRIHLYGLCDDGKYATAFRRAYLGNRLFSRHYEPLPDRHAVNDAPASDPFALAATGWFDAAAYGDRVRGLPLGHHPDACFLPTAAAVQAGEYPLGSALMLWFDLAPGAVLALALVAYLQLILSSAGQPDAVEGYLPLNAVMLDAERQTLSLLLSAPRGTA